MGAVPDWYPYVLASTYCPAVKPWEWVGNEYWFDRVVIARNAEIGARNVKVTRVH